MTEFEDSMEESKKGILKMPDNIRNNIGQTGYQEKPHPTLQQYLRDAENKKHFLALSKLYGVKQSLVQDGVVTPDAKVEASSA